MERPIPGESLIPARSFLRRTLRELYPLYAMKLTHIRLARLLRCSFLWLVATWLLSVGPTTAQALSVVPPTFEELVNESGRIVQAQVTAVESFRTVSPTGHSLIKTRVTWTVTNVLKGDVAKSMELEFLGGRTGDEVMAVSGMPEFRVGDRDFLFVEPNEKVICPLIAAGYGRYPIVANQVTGAVEVRRSNGLALTQTAQVGDPLDQTTSSSPAAAAMTPDEFSAAVLSVLRGDPKRE